MFQMGQLSIHVKSSTSFTSLLEIIVLADVKTKQASVELKSSVTCNKSISIKCLCCL